MPKAGDSYTVTIKNAHLNWGTHRHTYSRDRIYGESYIQIPSKIAYNLDIKCGCIYNATSSDGNFNHELLASGTQNDPQFAKQFQGNGNLKALGTWLHNYCLAEVDDKIKVEWTSPTAIVLTFISTH